MDAAVKQLTVMTMAAPNAAIGVDRDRFAMRASDMPATLTGHGTQEPASR
ncbi:hypothetical protein GCM10009858_45470 [Terrabacter carboxydivorans]|uniref:Uncharacterized protein n=1 Tax=Terrabacter carboxydivorans TaxID=619730 RepID=A0ABN3MIL5_9MICO